MSNADVNDKRRQYRWSPGTKKRLNDGLEASFGLYLDF